MKKLLSQCAALMVFAGLVCSPALADYTLTFNDDTLVRQQGTTNWMDVVGAASHYDIFNTSVTWKGTDVIIKIHTNDNGTPAFSQDKIADFAVDKGANGSWDTGIVLKTHDTTFTQGQVYTGLANTSWNYSTAYPSGQADAYDTTNNPVVAGSHTPAPIPVLLNSGTSSFTGSVAWSGSGPYDVTITLLGINTDGSWNDFTFLWGSETCGNDTQSNRATVPLPGAVLLLGAGLARLTAYARRRQA